MKSCGKRWTGFLLSLVLLGLFVPRVLGQEVQPTIAVGTTLRITLASETTPATDRPVQLTGTLVRSISDSLIVTDPSGRNHAVPHGVIRDLEAKKPRTRGEGAIRGLKWGGLLGGISGATLGAIEGAACRGGFLCPGPWGGAAILGGAFGIIGVGIGAGVGALSPGDKWVRVSMPRADDSSASVGDGRLKIAVTWQL